MRETDFGYLLSTLMDRAGMSQADFAVAAHCKEPYVSRVRTGRLKPPRDGTIERWADILGASSAERYQMLESAALEITPDIIRRKFIRLATMAIAV